MQLNRFYITTTTLQSRNSEERNNIHTHIYIIAHTHTLRMMDWVWERERECAKIVCRIFWRGNAVVVKRKRQSNEHNHHHCHNIILGWLMRCSRRSVVVVVVLHFFLFWWTNRQTVVVLLEQTQTQPESPKNKNIFRKNLWSLKKNSRHAIPSSSGSLRHTHTHTHGWIPQTLTQFLQGSKSTSSFQKSITSVETFAFVIPQSLLLLGLFLRRRTFRESHESSSFPCCV